MSVYVDLDLTALPPPQAIEELSYEGILAALKTDFQARYPSFVDILESDPVTKVLEAFAYRELLLRNRINHSVSASYLATATGADLEHLAALFGLTRKVVQEASQETGSEEVLEDDDALRKRILLAPEGLTGGGTAGAYKAHALAADAGVKDVGITSPSPGVVRVEVLAQQTDSNLSGLADRGLIAKVKTALMREKVRAVTDSITVVAATIQTVAITATVTLAPGPQKASVLEAAIHRVKVPWPSAQHKIGGKLTPFMVGAALQGEGDK